MFLKRSRQPLLRRRYRALRRSLQLRLRSAEPLFHVLFERSLCIRHGRMDLFARRACFRLQTFAVRSGALFRLVSRFFDCARRRFDSFRQLRVRFACALAQPLSGLFQLLKQTRNPLAQFG